MNLWENYKKMFYAWEKSTAAMLDVWMQSPLLLEPAGAWLTAMMKMKANADKATAEAWGTLGLPTKRDQERTLHALNQIQSRLMDLEDRLADLQADKSP